MDFYDVVLERMKNGKVVIRPDFRLVESKDLMIRGNAFYAIWDEERGIWSTDLLDLYRLIKKDLDERRQEVEASGVDMNVGIESPTSAHSKTLTELNTYLRNMRDNYHQLDNRVVFADTVVKRRDYVSKRLPYSLSSEPCPNYDELMSCLYDPEERAKLEWAIGAIFCGDGKKIQKFIVLYGEAGSGKSTVLNIIQQLFEGYYTVFEAKTLVGNNNAFSTDAFRNNPLVAIQHDGDLSRIEDNSKLNSIVSHEEMQINEKYKSSYSSKFNCFLFMGTNRAVRITDAKSGIIRRLIDVNPSGRRIAADRYYQLMDNIAYESGQIANHCINVYEKMGKNYYNTYRPTEMISSTDPFYNFILENYFEFKRENAVSLKRAWALYKEYFDQASLHYDMPMYKFREELKNYFQKFYPMTYADGKQIYSYYEGFLAGKITEIKEDEDESSEKSNGSSNVAGVDNREDVRDSNYGWCNFQKTLSVFDKIGADWPAQYATRNDIPQKAWDKVATKLGELDTKRVHYVRVPANHIVIDFDLKDADGNKSDRINLEAASKWPETYGEFSKGGAGVHLHYIYDGDPEKLSRIYEEGIEIKVFTGKSSLRRKLSKCNDLPIAHISSGLPLKGEKAVVNFEGVKNEKAIRTMILRNLNKEYHAYTTPSVQFIAKILDDAYQSGITYDVTDLRPAVMAFAAKSSNQSSLCLKYVSKMKFKSEDLVAEVPKTNSDEDEEDLVFYDVEVFPNLFLVNYKERGPDKKCVRMINPSPEDIEKLMRFKLVGFNCRRYDNHMIYARYLGYDNDQLYRLSQRIVAADKKDESARNCFFREAYNISYTDVYDFASAGNKKSLKKWEIELGIHHQELGLPWDQPVPEERWVEVAEYCDNDVISTEATFDHLSGDWTARKMLAKLAGMTVNDTTNTLTTRIIFGKNRNPQLVYTDLATGEQDVPGYKTEYINSFPGYEYVNGTNMFRGEDVGRGGYVWAIPGIYHKAVTFDVRGMHPSSIIAMNYFGEYTPRYKDIIDARACIKHKDYDAASKMMDGQLTPYLNHPEDAKGISNALKTAGNSCYGLSSASFPNPMRHPKNNNNIVALRGALFMVTLRDEILARGGKPFHIKTDSIKLENPSKEITEFIFEFGRKYGYEFEIEHKFEKICLVNDSVYIAKLAADDPDDPGKWTATGAQFAHPYIFKTLFSHEPLVFRDLCETKEVKTAIYLDCNEDLSEGEHNYQFVGKVGLFCPIKPGCGGGLLVAQRGEKYNAVSNSTGYRWLEAELVGAAHKEHDIDMRYFRGLVDDAVAKIQEFGDAEHFMSEEDSEPYFDVLPWCDKEDCASCADREECHSLAASFVNLKGENNHG